MFGLIKRKLLATKKDLKNKQIRRGPKGLLIFNRKTPLSLACRRGVVLSLAFGPGTFHKEKQNGINL